ncbi:uncharacterized protein N7518_002927 [Penicillium psychrosexuale]|uniref:uncharacterized protein n=1 Tax=Penicillium psychrosexuale TaxID=1002107 RepID=UPI002545513F|nr:uncharacterized protein N7518_002927 [Penicillium psychrosexuale]KAJ5800859.1 hypothetical protein N7518_002927 [Penicillium psychrosexuale]
MTIIYLRFSKNPAPVEDIALVTKTLRDINPGLDETERTEDTITFSSPDHDVDIFGEIFEEWLHSEPPVITTFRMLADS